MRISKISISEYDAKKARSTSTSGSFSEFFRNAPSERKKEVFKKVAERANEDQRKLFNQANRTN